MAVAVIPMTLVAMTLIAMRFCPAAAGPTALHLHVLLRGQPRTRCLAHVVRREGGVLTAAITALRRQSKVRSALGIAAHPTHLCHGTARSWGSIPICRNRQGIGLGVWLVWHQEEVFAGVVSGSVERNHPIVRRMTTEWMKSKWTDLWKEITCVNESVSIHNFKYLEKTWLNIQWRQKSMFKNLWKLPKVLWHELQTVKICIQWCQIVNAMMIFQHKFVSECSFEQLYKCKRNNACTKLKTEKHFTNPTSKGFLLPLV